MQTPMQTPSRYGDTTSPLAARHVAAKKAAAVLFLLTVRQTADGAVVELDGHTYRHRRSGDARSPADRLSAFAGRVLARRASWSDRVLVLYGPQDEYLLCVARD